MFPFFVARSTMKRSLLSADRPLVFPKGERPTADDRTIVYQKGAYVLYRLREPLGDEAFWTGIRHYPGRTPGSR